MSMWPESREAPRSEGGTMAMTGGEGNPPPLFFQGFLIGP